MGMQSRIPTEAVSAAKILMQNRFRSMFWRNSLGGLFLRHPRVAGVGCLDKQLGFLDEPTDLVLGEFRRRILVSLEQVIRKLPAGITVMEELSIDKSSSEFTNDLVGLIPDIEELDFD